MYNLWVYILYIYIIICLYELCNFYRIVYIHYVILKYIFLIDWLIAWLIDWLGTCFFKFKFSSYNNSKMSCRFYMMYLIFSSNFEFTFDILVFILLLKRMPSVFVLLHLKPFCLCSAKKGGSFKSLFRILLILSTEFYIRYMYH